jgi:hypothetical protein
MEDVRRASRHGVKAASGSANTVAAVSLANDILRLITTLDTALQAVAMSVRKAQAEGRDLTERELQALREKRTAVLCRLQFEISRRQRGGAT